MVILFPIHFKKTPLLSETKLSLNDTNGTLFLISHIHSSCICFSISLIVQKWTSYSAEESQVLFKFQKKDRNPFTSSHISNTVCLNLVSANLEQIHFAIEDVWKNFGKWLQAFKASFTNSCNWVANDLIIHQFTVLRITLLHLNNCKKIWLSELSGDTSWKYFLITNISLFKCHLCWIFFNILISKLLFITKFSYSSICTFL